MLRKNAFKHFVIEIPADWEIGFLFYLTSQNIPKMCTHTKNVSHYTLGEFVERSAELLVTSELALFFAELLPGYVKLFVLEIVSFAVR